MKVAFAVWNDRIAPVFDAAGQIYVVETEAGRIISSVQEFLPIGLLPVQKATRLEELGIKALVCGAISRLLYEMLVSRGIRVIPFIAGDLEEILRAWLTKRQDWNVFAMPGCCGKRYQFRQMHGIYKEEVPMNGKRHRGAGQGNNRSQDREYQRFDKMGGLSATGLDGDCTCPQCGQREPHQRGVPCFEQKCPKCGSAMTRK